MTKNNYNNTGILKSVSGNSRSSGYSQSEDTTNASFDDDTFDSDDEKNSALLQEIRSSAQGPNPTTSVTPDRLNGLNIQSNQRNYSERRRLHERILHERNTQVDSVVVPSELANHDETAAAMNYIWMMRSLKRNNRMDRRALLSQQAPSFMARSIASIASSFQSYESTRGKGDLIVEGTPLMSVRQLIFTRNSNP